MVIGKNKNFGFPTFLIVGPSLKSFNNSQKFTIVSFVLSFS